MKAVVISALVAAAIVLTVALTPISGWVFKNQIDMLVGGTPWHDNDPLGPIEALVPAWITNPKTYSGPDPSEQIAHAVLTDYPTRNRLLQEYTVSHPNDPLGWALLARLSCTLNGGTPDQPSKSSAQDLQTQTEVFTAGRNACLAGERLEPDNAYFPYMQAIFEMHLNHRAEISEDLASAASKPSFNGHLKDWGEAMQRALILEKGYRGEVVARDMEASLLLPDLAHAKSLGRYLNRQGTLKEKRDMIQIQGLICRQGQLLIEGLVALANVRLALRPPLPIEAASPKKLDEGEWLSLANGFDNKLRTAGIAPPTPGTPEIDDMLVRFDRASQKYMDTLPAYLPQQGSNDSETIKLFLRTIAPYASLFALLGIVPFGIAAWGFTGIKSDAVRRMVPHLLCLPAWWITVCLAPHDNNPIGTNGLWFGLAQIPLSFVHLAVQKKPRGDTMVFVAGALLAWIPDLLPDQSSVLGCIAYFMAIALLSNTRSDKISLFGEGATIVFFVVLSALAGATVLLSGKPGEPPGVWAASLLIGLCAASLFTGKPVRTAKIAISSTLLIFSATYLVSVGLEVRGNHAESLAHNSLTDEAAGIRRMANID